MDKNHNPKARDTGH